MKLDDDLDRILCAAAAEHGIDANLLRAICFTETNGNRWAVRFEPSFSDLVSPSVFAKKLGISLATEQVLQKTSWGPMQIMGAVARQNGFVDHLTKLTDLALAFDCSCTQLAHLLERWPAVPSAVAAWNWGHPQKLASGKFANQAYVDEVLSYLARLRTAT